MYAPLVGSLLGLLHLAKPALGTFNKDSALESSPPPILPNKDAARRNAHRVFNTLHSAGRQWGSSIDHNGMSFFHVTVPKGNYLFHGTETPDRPTGFEWLAFEIEHAQNFAETWDPDRGHGILGEDDWHDWRPRRSVHGAKSRLLFHDAQQPMGATGERQPGYHASQELRGYLQTYQAARPLNLLYVDGMAAGKSGYGTLDTQDYILRGKEPRNFTGKPDNRFWGEAKRAAELCEIADDWARQGGVRIDGFMRMEAGFEIIYCRFEQGGGLDLVRIDASAFRNETGWVEPEVQALEWMRACASRYDGFPKSRLSIDWSRMVSAYFYNVNLTNPDITKSELPRVVNTTKEERAAIKFKVQETMAVQRHGSSEIDWQGIVDLIVGRYSDRLALLSKEETAVDDMRREVNFLLAPYIDFAGPDSTPSPERCRSKHIETALAGRPTWTQEDELIFTAVDTVADDVCSALREMWEILGQKDVALAALAKPKRIIRELNSRLDWSTWKRCGTCASLVEVCFVAMFPFGSVEDHYNPRCKNKTEILGRRGHGGSKRYW